MATKVEIVTGLVENTTASAKVFLEDLKKVKQAILDGTIEEMGELSKARDEEGNPLKVTGDIWEAVLEEIKDIIG
tara:strand:+ start:5192 stop:5416 length:225 start_codon:yes stop_codon:yes gene_type:complete